jgi:hypothetical protein
MLSSNRPFNELYLALGQAYGSFPNYCQPPVSGLRETSSRRLHRQPISICAHAFLHKHLHTFLHKHFHKLLAAMTACKIAYLLRGGANQEENAGL